MNNYGQEGQKVGLEGHPLMPSQPPYPPGQPPYPSGQPPYSPSQPPPYSPSQPSYPPSQQPYPPVQPGYPQVTPAYPPPQPGYPPAQPGYPPAQPGYPPQGPISNQPMGQGDPNWMQRPQAMPNCPPGLEYLASIDQLLVYQKLDLLETITNFEMENKYTVHNVLGQMVYHATEESGTCIRNCCGSSRPFEMMINDNFGQEVLHFSRPLKCQCCCCFCCLQTMEVCSPPGIMIGTIEQNWNPLFPSFSLKNPSGDEILQIKGPFCTVSCCCSDIEFEVFSANGDTPIGKITKKWTGYVREAFTNADNFGISFPKDLDVKMKAVLLGALFLIDMMYFEQKPQSDKKN